MKLLINPEGGLAGDMMIAGLISAGADFNKVKAAMTAAGEKLGTVAVDLKEAPDGANQLHIELDSQRHHLGGMEAQKILTELFERFGTGQEYRELGLKILDILIKAEIRAHAEFDIVISEDHSHSHHHTHDNDDSHHHHDDVHHHHSHHSHNHSHQDDEKAFLHEAQDIIIDIMGTITAMELLSLETRAQLTGPVYVGGGHVHCSHGTLSIPAPATTVIMEEYGLEWQRGPIERELFTPTGAAITAALTSGKRLGSSIESIDIKAEGKSRGTKILDIPPLKLFLY